MPKLAEISFQSVSITLNYMNNNVMFQFISVCLRYLVHVLVRSAMNQYRFFYIVLVFWNILVLVLVLVNK